MKRSLIPITLMVLSGCASPSGANWALADFNKYDRNYAEFQTQNLTIGAPKQEILTKLGENYSVVEAGKGYEVIAYQQWVAAAGPDYVGKTLYLQFDNQELSHWKVTSDTVAVVPPTW